MIVNKEYFLNRLASGESIDAIGNEIAALMTEAANEHEANLRAEMERRAEAEKQEAKKVLVEELVEVLQELAILEGLEPEDMELDDEGIEQMVAALSEVFGVILELKALSAALEKASASAPEAPKATIKARSDDQILADFIKMFN
jgi:leucyl aminopeptidase (aminopeptidase T)